MRLAFGYISIFFIGVIDYLIGVEISFSLFYLIGMYLAVWYGDRIHGIIVSFLASIIWYEADLLAGHIYSNPLIPFWNASVRLGFFLLFTFLLAWLLEHLRRETLSARHDFLTGLQNSRAFYETVSTELKRSERYSHTFLIAYIDLDNFKQVNDTRGHIEGDRLLKHVSKIMSRNIRENDVAARLGGDEFALLIPEASHDGSVAIIHKLHQKLLKEMQSKEWPVTFSVGAVFFDRPPQDAQEAVSVADNLMYSVKKNGKNAVVVENYPVE